MLRASCRCGALSATAVGAPTRISVCHCLECQKRSGSAFSAKARFAERDVNVAGPYQSWRTVGGSGRWAEFDRCSVCGDQLAYRIEAMPGVVAIPLGTFENPHAFVPQYSVWEERKHNWVSITGNVEHME